MFSKPLKNLVTALALVLICSFVHAPTASAAINTTFGDPVFVVEPNKSQASIAMSDSVIGFEDGHHVMYSTVTGNPPEFLVINLDTYELERSLTLPGGTNGASHVVAPDGRVYIASSGGLLYRYSPVTKAIESLGKISSGQTAIYDLNVDEEGNVYGGTYPSARVFKFDPNTSQFSHYGSLSETNSYVRSLVYYEKMLYAGIGTDGSIVKLDPETGEKTEIPLPPIAGIAAGDYPSVYSLDAVDKYLFAQLSGKGKNILIAYDLEQGQWRSEQFEHFHGSIVSQPMNGKAYYKMNGDGGFKLVELDLATFETRVMDMMQDFSMKGGGWVVFPDDAELPGPTLVNMRYDGKIGFFHIPSETHVEKPPLMQGEAIPIHALEKGPDGKLYMSSYPGGTGSIYNPSNEETIAFRFNQAESIGFMGEHHVFYNLYPDAHIYLLDTTKPIEGLNSDNPKFLFEAGEQQDRPYVNLTVGGKLYLGTIPDYGELGGALVVYDSESDETVKHKVFRNIVQDQSIVGLAHQDGKIFGSTTIVGGLDSTPTASEAKMFVWDPQTEQKIAEFAPVLPDSGAITMISGLTFGPDGLLWAAANGTIFAVDPDTQEVVKSKEIYEGVEGYGMWRPIHLRWGTDGLLYTDLHGKLTVVSPDTMEVHKLNISSPLFTLGDDGNIYYAQSTKLMMIPVNQGEHGSDPSVGEYSIHVPAVPIAVDRIVPISVQVKNANQLYAVQTVVNYDPAHFAVENVTLSDSFGNSDDAYFQYNADTAGQIQIVATHSGDSYVNGDIEVAEIKMRALSEGDTTVTLSADSELAKNDADITGMTETPESDIVLVMHILTDLSDVNEDGEVNLLDIVRVAKQIGALVNEQNRTLDVNQDGSIDIVDLALVSTNILNH